jgi:hypothetical protein
MPGDHRALAGFVERGSLRPPGRQRRRAQGQTLVEFALILPLFMLVLTAVIEFGFLFNSYLAINFASREASLVAAEAGNLARADCLILNSIDQSVGSPSDPGLITEVEIYRADRAGNPINGKFTKYVRGAGVTSCDLPGGGDPLVVPYVVGADDYKPIDRCNRLVGCKSGETGVDQIGVKITYMYSWHTPLGNLFGGSAGKTRLEKANIMRMEPVL